MFTMHVLLASVTEEPLLLIDEQESKLLADATEKALAQFDVVSVLSPKTAALIDLGLVAGTIYGPRLMKMAQKRKKERRMTITVPPQPKPNGAAAEQPAPFPM